MEATSPGSAPCATRDGRALRFVRREKIPSVIYFEPKAKIALYPLDTGEKKTEDCGTSGRKPKRFAIKDKQRR
jgi:hypothetical protein